MGIGINRRVTLQSLACGVGGYFASSAWSVARGAVTPPRRLLVVTTQHANPYSTWSMRRPGLSETAEWEFPLADLPREAWSAALAPLYDLRRKLLVLDSLSNPIGIDISQGGGGHYNGPKTALTGAPTTKGASPVTAGGPSIDQIIASRVFVSGGLRSLELGYGGSYPFVWSAQGQPLATRTVAAAYQAAFVDRAVKPGGTPPAPTTPSRDDAIKATRGQVLEFVRSRHARVASRLSGAEKARLENHAALVGDLANRLSGTGTGGQTPVTSAGCFVPKVSSARAMDAAVADIAQLVTAAFACDVTRVATVQLGQMAPSDFGAGDVEDVHQDIAHHGEDAAKITLMGRYYQRHAEHLATILSALDGVVEPDGSRLLDQTIVLWIPECGSWIHQMSHLPVVLAGGGGFRMGRYVHFGNVDPVRANGGNSGDKYTGYGPPIYRLLVSIARQMGLADVDRVGTVNESLGLVTRGPLDRLL